MGDNRMRTREQVLASLELLEAEQSSTPKLQNGTYTDASRDALRRRGIMIRTLRWVLKMEVEVDER